MTLILHTIINILIGMIGGFALFRYKDWTILIISIILFVMFAVYSALLQTITKEVQQQETAGEKK